jgi:tetratricopeptide (TPR) repeat protein
MVQAKLGKSDVAVRALDQELGHLQADPDNAAYCLLYRTYVANDLDPSSSLQYAQQALERFHAAQNVDAVDEGLFLEAMARSLYLNGSNSEADRYYALALRHYTQLGRENTPNAITIRSNWALMINKSGAPKRALELTDQILASIAQRNPASRPPSFVVANRARALEAIGRYGEARAAYELELRLARQSQDAAGQVHSLSGLASVAERLGDRAAAVRYLEEWDAMVRSTEPANSPRWAGMDVMRGRLDLADGNVEAARAHFDKALAKATALIRVDAQLGRAEAELRTGDATAAASDAQHALDDATSLQGGLPYSNFTGLAWLMLGRAQQQLGNVDRAGQAFESAIVQLSNTVDADHPALVEARRMAEAAR